MAVDGHREERLTPREVESRTHRLVTRPRETPKLVPLASKALDGGDRRQNLEGALDNTRFENLDPFGAVGHRARVRAKAEIQEGRHHERQKGECRVEIHQDGEHDRQVCSRQRQGEHTADDEVVDTVGVGIEPVDGVSGRIGHMMTEGQ